MSLSLVIIINNLLSLGSHPSYIKIYFHQGEVLFLRCKDPDLDEIAEIVQRLRAVTGTCVDFYNVP